jgi:hypothetical protein
VIAKELLVTSVTLAQSLCPALAEQLAALREELVETPLQLENVVVLLAGAKILQVDYRASVWRVVRQYRPLVVPIRVRAVTLFVM